MLMIFSDKPIRNPKDSFSSHLWGYISDEEFRKAIILKILQVKIHSEFTPFRRNKFCS